MTKGLIHGHQGLAYLMLLSVSVSLLLSLVNAALGSRSGLVRAGVVFGRKIEPALMGIIGLLGIGSWVMVGFPVTTLYLWAGVVAVVAQAMLVVKGTKPVLVALSEGDAAVRWRWPIFAFAQVVLVYGIVFVMMSN